MVYVFLVYCVKENTLTLLPTVIITHNNTKTLVRCPHLPNSQVVDSINVELLKSFPYLLYEWTERALLPYNENYPLTNDGINITPNDEYSKNIFMKHTQETDEQDWKFFYIVCVYNLLINDFN